jgi:FKBP-type peptidyl-prolyl cis-trans isomerase
MPDTNNRRTAFMGFLAVGVAIVALIGCSPAAADRVEVTGEMKARALEQIDRGEMPDFDSWEMQETDDGVRYVVLRPGEGETAWYDDDVRVHYYLWLTDGTPVDSTRPDGVSKPFEFTVGGRRVIDGWNEVIQVMNDGSRVLAVVPWEMGYGRQGRRNIPGRSDLVFAIELLRIR